jgi:murein L,D-transpeptidase YafK
MVMTATPKRRTRASLAMVMALFVAPAFLFAQEAGARDGTEGGGAASAKRTVEPLGVEIILDDEPAVRTGPAADDTELLVGLANASDVSAAGFLDRQLRFPRVRQAFSSRAETVDALFLAQGIAQPAELFFRVFKREQLLEVWARGAEAETFALLNTYPVCGTSGELGPKRHQGDEQIPEGFYSIDLFNPVSNFHLSLRVDYPNAVDRARGTRRGLGGDIFIHGGCATIGCVPVTDEWIEEIYLMAVRARDAGQDHIAVHMFPTRLDEAGMSWLYDTYGTDHPDLVFWLDLRLGYLAFEQTRTVPEVAQHRGRYVFPMGQPAAP